ncbi:hypothetical protein [Reyranella soli]|nr:hypothetical protein [Reyranella soli]
MQFDEVIVKRQRLRELTSEDEDGTAGDIVIGVCWLLEKFASRARASGPECVSARARFLELVTGDEDGWSLGDFYESALAKAVSEDVRAMRRVRFINPEPFGDGRVVGRSAWDSWLAFVVERADGLDAVQSDLIGDVELQAAE